MSNKIKFSSKDIDRCTVTFPVSDNEYCKDDEHNIRLYNIDGNLYPSASTITHYYSNSKKEHILNSWMDKYDGSVGSAHHKDLKNLKALRGTIAHARTLSEFVEGEIWGEEEIEAQRNIERFEVYRESYIDSEKYPWNPSEIPFFNDGETAVDWCERTVPQIKEDLLTNVLTDVHEVVAVEEYIHSKELGMAGQVDLVYKTKSGKLVVCDIKTSKNVYHTHKLQTAGYAKAFEEENNVTVDMLKIARASPESYGETAEAQILLEWDETREELENEFRQLTQWVYTVMTNQGMRTISEKFKNQVNSTA